MMGMRLLYHDIKDGSASPYPANRGGVQFANLIQSYLSEQPDHLHFHELCRLLAMHLPRNDLLDWWIHQFSTAPPKSVAAWIRCSAYLGIAPNIPTDVATKALDTAEGEGLPELVSAGATLTNTRYERVEIHVALAGELVEYGATGSSLAADVARVFDPIRFLLMAVNDQYMAERLRLIPTLVDPQVSLDRPTSRVRSAVGWSDAVDAIRTRAGQRGTTSVWGNVARTLDQEYGRSWLAREIAIVAASVTDLRLGGDFTPGALGLGTRGDLGMLIRHIRFHRNDADQWQELLQNCTGNDLDNGTWVLAFASCAGSSAVEELYSTFSDVLIGLSPSIWRRVARASFRLGSCGRCRELPIESVAHLADHNVEAAALLAHFVAPSLRWRILTRQPVDAGLSQRFAEPAIAKPLLDSYAEASVYEDPAITKFLALGRHVGPDVLIGNDCSEWIAHANVAEIREIAGLPWALTSACDQILDNRGGDSSLLDFAEAHDWFVEDDEE
jgi:hypothetical protein